jgi:dihydroorotase
MKQVFRNLCAIDDVNISRKDIYVEDGIIVDEFVIDEDVEIVDCNNLFLLPSFSDMHVHFRDPGFTYKEDLETGSKAALKGGFTTVNLMANTNPPVSRPEVYEDIKKRAKELDLIDIEQVYTITKDAADKSLDHLDDLPESVKFLSDDGRGVNNDTIMYKAMLKAKDLGVNLTLHEEVANLSKLDYELAEDLMTIRDCYLSYKLDTPIHFSHVSTRGSIKAIEYFKNLGAPITCEVTPHHLYFSDRDDLRVNPPIRTEEDRKTLIDMVRKGVVDCIATDHAPHTKEDKEKRSPGYIGLETAFSTCYEVLVKSKVISLNKLVEIMSTNPARLLGYKKGKIEKGYLADFTLVDLDKEYIYQEEDIVSKSKNSLMIGKKLYGSIERVYKRGVLKYENNR